MDKKILEICLSPDLGGLELHCKDMSYYLNAFMVINIKSKLEPFLQNKSHPYKKIGRYNFFALAKIIDEKQIDVIHLHWTKDIPVVVLAKLLSKQSPKVVQTRNMHIDRSKSNFYYKFLYKNVDMIIAVTNLVKKQLETFIHKSIQPKIKTCYMGAVTPKILNLEEKSTLKTSLGLKDEFIVAIVGRIEKQKGQHIVLQAVEKLRQNGIQAKTLVIGHAMNESYLENIKKSYQKDIFTGFVNNASDLMQIADCLVLATQKETFGLVLIEAMKCGICVLGSNSGGPLEIIDDEKNGLLFESMDSDDLYKKLLYLVNDENKKIALALKGKEKANINFDSQIQFEKFKALLENI